MRSFKKLKRWFERSAQPPVRIVYEPLSVFDNALLTGRTALVTGAGGTIGPSIVGEMLAQGAAVIAVDIDPVGLDRLREGLGDAGADRLSTMVCDISRQDSVDELCRSLDDAGSVIDTLVNNVGIHSELQSALEGEFSNWQRLFETNLFGPYRLTRKIVARLMQKESPGSVIFVTSVNQWQVRGHPAYSASKAALGMIVKELADELAPSGIRVNGIAPGLVRQEPDGMQVPSPHTPLFGTPIPPRYIGRSAVYLASDYFSRHTTGSVLVIDAGILARGFPYGNARLSAQPGSPSR